MNNQNLQEKLRPIIDTISRLFSTPEPRLFGTCIKSKASNINVHTNIEVVIDPQTGQKHCKCPLSRNCKQEPRAIDNAKPLSYLS